MTQGSPCIRVLTQDSADAYDGVKEGPREAGPEPHHRPVGQAYPQGLVLGNEGQPCVGVDATLIQGPGRPQEPLLFLLPPEGVV